MKHLFHYTCIALLLLLVLAGCSRKKNSFLSRNLHAVGTEYNVLYNGNLALQEGLDGLEQTYRDNYWEVLPVERMTVDEEVSLGAKKEVNPSFERAEEKAVKAVQKHSMLINETEYNPQIDEAYMLLGKARYYDQRFIPALEAFNYILQFMPESNQINQAKVWREKTNMRLENNEIAIKNLRKLFKETPKEDFEEEDLAIANATLAQAFLNLEQVDSAIVYMNRAEGQTQNRETQARYKFITAQLFAEAGRRDSAYVHYDQIIEMHRKIPRRYYVNAFIEKIKLFDEGTDSKQELLELLNDLAENRENRPWLDAIYSRKAIYYENEDSIEGAKEFYNKSLRALQGQDQYLKGNNYSALGKISFDQSRFVDAGKYYDSALTKYTERTNEYRLVRKKRRNLDDVILYEGWRRSADSIFEVLAMTPEQQEAYYQDHIDQLKAEEERIAREAEIQAAKDAQNQNAFTKIKNNSTTRRGQASPGFGPPGGSKMPPNPGMNPANKGAGDVFYFYNTQTVARGKLDFKAKWGKRELRDNWRRMSSKDVLDTDEALVDTEEITEEVRPDFTTAYYINDLPESQEVLDSIADSRDFAYYQLGVIYKEKFKRNDLAVDRFDRLLTFDPEEKLQLPALYNLYLIYKDAGADAFAKAEEYKNRIISQYPDTRYAQLLRSPDGQIDLSQTPTGVYKLLYKQYEQENYAYVIKNVERYAQVFSGDPIVPRLELLKAFAAGRLYGFKEYKKGIDYVALNFPNTEVGKSAVQLVKDAEALKIPEQFLPENGLTDFKLVYRFDNTEQEAIAALVEQLRTSIAEENYTFTVSTDVYNTEETLVVVHGLSSKLGATGLAEMMAAVKGEGQMTRPYLSIATDNYKIIQMHKNLDKYEQEML